MSRQSDVARVRVGCLGKRNVEAVGGKPVARALRPLDEQAGFVEYVLEAELF